MESVEQMREWLANMSFDEWEAVGEDHREDNYAMAWAFWATHAPADQISYEYEYIKDCVARYGSDGGDDEDEDDFV